MFISQDGVIGIDQSIISNGQHKLLMHSVKRTRGSVLGNKQKIADKGNPASKGKINGL